MHPVEALLQEVDRLWSPSGEGRVALRILGSTALILQTDYRRGTKDSDVLETAHLDAARKRQLLHLAGRDSALHTKHGVYIEILAPAFAFLTEDPAWVRLPGIDEELRHFTVEVLDVVDVVVAKLARLHGGDREDIRAMVDRDLVSHQRLVERFRSAVGRLWFDARADDLPRHVRNLHWVERDLLDVRETEIELPDWG